MGAEYGDQAQNEADFTEWGTERLVERRQEITGLLGDVAGRGEERREQLGREVTLVFFELWQRAGEGDQLAALEVEQPLQQPAYS
jgi:hypothetical protein